MQNSEKSQKKTRLASIIIVTYNHREYLDACLESVLKQDYPHEIILVDNCSQDGTVSFVRERFPEVTVVESPDNRGYGAGNNLGVQYARGEYIVILNPDTMVEEGWLSSLLSPLKRQPKVITTSKILLYDGLAINTCGNINTITGLTFTRGLGADPSSFPDAEEVSGVSGACFAMRREDYLDLGGFDENFFLYNEDSELSWRAHLRDYRVLYVPTSVVRHDYQLSVSPEKIYFLEKGRYMILRKYFSRRDILLFSPSLLIAELLTLGYALRFGRKGLALKFKAIREGLGATVERVASDEARVFPHLCMAIPEDQLTFNEFERFGKVISNKILKWNSRVI
jgi:GT2 family glycosyltransferase